MKNIIFFIKRFTILPITENYTLQKYVKYFQLKTNYLLGNSTEDRPNLEELLPRAQKPQEEAPLEKIEDSILDELLCSPSSEAEAG